MDTQHARTHALNGLNVWPSLTDLSVNDTCWQRDRQTETETERERERERGPHTRSLRGGRYVYVCEWRVNVALL